MCGIFGAFGPGIGTVGAAAEQAALAALAHRGPDAKATWRGERVLLGHRRLSILDLDPRAHQPMQRGPLTIVFNGEIYNFRALADKLRSAGETFSTTSDTEVLLAGLLSEGIAFLDKVEGMFAFGLVDARDGSLLLARDRFGEKPLFVHETPSLVSFASEISGLEALAPAPLEEDPLAIGLYMRLSYVPAPYAPLRGVTQIEPGAWRRYGSDLKREEGRYYTIPSAPARRASISYESAVAEVRRQVIAATDLRLKTADVPVATLLSGGLDSSIVTSVASSVSEKPVTAYSLSFPDDPAFDEGVYASALASRLPHIEHRLIPARVDDLLAFTGQMFERLSEPLADSSLVPTAFLMSHIEEKVVLGGDGADEVFAGYGIYASMRASARLPHLLKRLLRTVPAHSNPAAIREPRLRAAALFHASLSEDPLAEYLHWRSYARRADLAALGLDVDLNGAIAASVGKTRSGSLRDIQEVDIAFNLPNDMLRKVDIAGMMFGIEARLPYLDSDLVEFALSLPDDFRMKGSVRKRILRDAFSAELPAEILHRRKMGFLMPIRQWFREGMLRERLADMAGSQTRFDPGVLSRLLDEHRAGVADHSVLLWAVLVYLQWREGRGARARACAA
ncbi:asparagine synthase (glutamine-hydrolyzing) [Afifella sp. IM 167]|uniref:asparagine synthase (glutamine-hydrolyzing) n=1 Tax=Afifella sp. IM 167 TaxID=2033586 RepID=UPI001CC9D8FE|nr:asparagine synthase (glutamine-hydrolyzing) [Afifella sp. IM 167]MBZ8134258.1 asparagine synthase (glutamine-hydrolyzing) [Afifella sp. IM 167]